MTTLTAQTADRLFNWAESVFTSLFPNHPASIEIAGYHARIYSNGDALGEKDGNIYYYDGGADGDDSITFVGTINDFLPSATLAGF